MRKNNFLWYNQPMDIMQLIFQIFYYAVFVLAAFFVVRSLLRPRPEAIRTEPKKYACLKIFIIAVLSRAVLLLLNWAAKDLLGNGSSLLDTWNRWDADQYLKIITQGYWSDTEGWVRVVFFPLYPAAVRLFQFGFLDARLSAMIVSWLCLGGACVYLYKLVLWDGDEASARRAVKFLLIFPLTVFLGAPFTESMFLMLSMACLYHMRQRRFLLACVFGGLAALTRNVGVLLALPVLIEMLRADGLLPPGAAPRRWARFAGHAAMLLIIPTGTAVYLLMNYALTGDAFMFLRMQQRYWSQGFGSYGNSLRVTWGQITSENTYWRNNLTLWISQFIVMIIAGATLPALCKKLRASYGAYALAYLFVVFAPTWLLSGFRYYMGLAVLYPALALLTRRRWADITLTVLFALLLSIYAYCFSVGWLVF
jgi:hypothetical protein